MTAISIPAKSALRTALITVPIILGIGFLSGQVSNSGYGNVWFDTLVKPDAMPPGWAFGAAWSVLYVLLGVVLAIVLSAPPTRTRSEVLVLFLLQLALNFCWSPIFFGAHLIELGLVTILAIAVLTLGAMPGIGKLSRPSAWLMIPYLAWLSFAAYLNFEIGRLNPAA